MERTTVISARVSRRLRDRLDEIGGRLRARDRSSVIKVAVEHFMAEYEAGRIQRVDAGYTAYRRRGGGKDRP